MLTIGKLPAEKNANALKKTYYKHAGKWVFLSGGLVAIDTYTNLLKRRGNVTLSHYETRFHEEGRYTEHRRIDNQWFKTTIQWKAEAAR